MSSSLLFGDESCGSLVDEMSKAFLGGVVALEVHESREIEGGLASPLWWVKD